MSKSPSTAEKPLKKTDKPEEADLVPPEERFWQRYSPHGELPLSGASSLALHLLFFGLLVFAAWLAYKMFGGAERSVPVEAVRLELDGGGGGSKFGEGDAPGGPRPQEMGRDETGEAKRTSETKMKQLDLTAEPSKDMTIKFDEDAARYIRKSDTAASRAMEKLAKANVQLRLTDRGTPGRGQGGSGSGGGKGIGKGPDTGDGRGQGSGKLTKREKRMLRWTLLFDARNGGAYVAQLRGLGAILAVPVREGPPANEYRLIRDLRPGHATLLNEDVYKLNKIRWFDDNPRSVADVMSVLGVRLSALPSHFIAFMPEELENKLLELELARLKKNHPNLTEDDIKETTFDLLRKGNKFEPRIHDLKTNR